MAQGRVIITRTTFQVYDGNPDEYEKARDELSELDAWYDTMPFKDYKHLYELQMIYGHNRTLLCY